MTFGTPIVKKFFYLIAKSCNLSVKGNEKLEFYHSCQLGKSHSLPFPNSDSWAESSFELIHSDVWGPASMLSIEGFGIISCF